MSVAVLKELCKERKIKKIAMVDDVFDVPVPESLDRVRYSEFRQRYNDDQDLKQAVAQVSGTRLESLPGLDNLDVEQLAPLWESVWKQQLCGRELKADYSQALRNLFLGHSDGVLGMLDTVVELLSLFRNDLGLKESVTVHGTDYDEDMVANAQIILIDYFLGKNLSTTEAFEKTLEVVANVVRVARQASKPVPSFLLVSARPEEIDVEKFRESAQLMKSRFRFFAKEDLRSKEVENMVNLHDLIDASGHTETIEGLIEDWQSGAREAVDAVRERMLSLDVSDFVYLDCYRLKHEGKSIGQYLRWFLTASLNATVTSKLTKGLWDQANEIRLFGLVDETGQLDDNTLAKTFDGPSDLIAHVYGEILFDETRGTGDCAFPRQFTGHDLVEGDLFVRPKGRNRKGFSDAEVRLVVTPSCDLVRRGPDRKPTAKNVLLLPGILKRVAQEDKRSNFADIDFVRVQERGEWHVFKIVWDFNRPISIDWTMMQDEGPGKEYKRLGRIRELHFHRIRDEFANRFTRIGTEVAPLLPHPRNGQVFITVVNGRGRKFEPVMCFDSTDNYIWEIGPVRITRAKGQTVMRNVYQASRQFIDKLREVLEHLPNERPDLKESAERIAGHLKDMKTYMDLVKPKEPGPRGVNGAVDFKKAVKRSEVTCQSNADLIIVTFVD